MAETVAQNQQSSFADPQNGTSPIDADEVTANDNALRGKFNTHDADDTIHVQGSLLADRPAFGTLGRKWMTRDAGVVRLFRDTGSAWEEISYIPSASDATITGILTFSTAPVFTNAQTFAAGVVVTTGGLTVTAGGLTVTAGGLLVSASGITVTGNSTITGTLGGLTGLTVASGGMTVTGNSTVTGTLGGVTTMTATTFSGSGASLTNLPAAELTGTLPAISGANLTTLNGTNISSGTVATTRLPTSIIVGTKVAAPLLGGETAQISINLSDTAVSLIDIGASSAVCVSSGSAPTGAIKYLKVTENGTAYFIQMRAA